ncbi:MAG: DUF1559 domain-containing protein [Pirellulaceae bacterium]
MPVKRLPNKRKISSYLGASSSSSKGPEARRGAGLYGTTNCDEGSEVASLLFNKGYNTNYATGWFLVRSQPLLVTGASTATSDAVTVGSLKEWFSGDAPNVIQHTAGPMRVSTLDAGTIPPSAIAFIGCGSRGDTAAGSGDGALNASIPAPYNIPAGAPCAESFNDGPSISDLTADKVVTAPTGTTRGAMETHTLLTVGQSGLDTEYRQDTRDMYAWHAKTLNVLFADGSVRTFEDNNGDGYINPGFAVNNGSATPELTGYTSTEVEVNGFDWYTGTFLDSAKHYREKV